MQVSLFPPGVHEHKLEHRTVRRRILQIAQQTALNLDLLSARWIAWSIESPERIGGLNLFACLRGAVAEPGFSRGSREFPGKTAA
jgi:hypothetical protein